MRRIAEVVLNKGEGGEKRPLEQLRGGPKGDWNRSLLEVACAAQARVAKAREVMTGVEGK